MKSEATDLIIPITDSYNSKSYYMSSQSLEKDGALLASKSRAESKIKNSNHK